MEHKENVRFYSFVNISVVSYSLSAILGMCVALPSGYITRYFGSSCVLYGTPRFRFTGNNTVLTTDKGTTVWGDMSRCYYTTYLPLVASIHGIIWVLSLISMKKMIKQGGPSYLLNILLNLVLVVAQFASSCILASGSAQFCENVERSLAEINLHLSCRQSQDIYWSIFTIRNQLYKHHFFSFLLMSQVCSWLLTGTILFQCVFSIYTIYSILFKDDTSSSSSSSDSKSLYAYTNVSTELLLDEETGSYTVTQTEKDKKDELFNL